jgi:hypothetical protein
VGGKSQLISIGGRVSYDNLDFYNDPWPHGIGVFDLSTFDWKDEFDADAPDYVTPDVIKSYIKRNGRYPAYSWSDAKVEKWFTQNNTEASDSSSHKPNTGAIAGGTVGGVVIIIAIAGYFFYTHKQKKNQKNDVTGHEPSRAELDAAERNEVQEVYGKSRPPEIDGTPRAELEGGWQGHEFRQVASPTEQRGP